MLVLCRSGVVQAVQQFGTLGCAVRYVKTRRQRVSLISAECGTPALVSCAPAAAALVFRALAVSTWALVMMY